MKKNLTIPFMMASVFLAAALVFAHPHFNKTVTVKLPGGTEAIITYNTTPANESHVTGAALGSFLNPRNPKLKLSAELKSGSVTIPAGEYTIGAIKNGDNDFTLALYPGTIARGTPVDTSKLIKLDSMYLTSVGKAPHLLIDISPGWDKLEGRAVLTLHFGSLFLAGALT